jgi:class 3 adenylate cyclase/tetratricopeptide (TPR) repeat protein
VALRTITILFTDLVDSTASAVSLTAADADRWREAHFGCLRQPLDTHGGREVKNLGDGLMVVFDSAAQAIDAAVAMQQGVEVSNRGTDLPAQSVRIGISLGEAVEEDGDYFGDPVVEAARLCAAADGGQILLTRLVELTAGRRTEQRVVGLGPRILKGFTDPVEVAEVRWEPVSDAAGAHGVPIPIRCLVEPTTGFIGRRTQSDLLADGFKEVVASRHSRAVMIGGEAGMGKTTLATTFARQAHTEGAIVLLGHADEELGLPYQVWVEVLRHLFDHAPPKVARARDAHRQALSRLLPLDGDTTSSGNTDADSARYALFEAVRAVLTAATELAPLVLVLDDLQWADAPSLGLLRHLITAAEPLPALVLATYRDSDVRPGSALSDLLLTLHREPGAQRISLSGLDDAELMSLMEAASGHDLDEDGLALRDALLSETNGNPFFVGELLRHLVETRALYAEGGRWVASADLLAHGLPVSVHEVVSRRVAAMGPAAGRVLEVAAVIGREFDVDTLVAAGDANETDVLDVLDAATATRLVVNIAPERYMFAHALVEHSLYDAVSPTRRARMHRAIAEALESRPDADARVAELAVHWAKATTPQDPQKATHYAIAAGARALTQLASDEAVRWYTQALELSSQRSGGSPQERAQILAGLGEAQRDSGLAEYRETLLEASRLAIEVGADDLLVATVLANTRGFQNNTGSVDRERVEVLQAALNARGAAEPGTRAMLLALLNVELLYEDGFDDRQARFLEALRLARLVGDDRTLAAVITTGWMSIHVPHSLDERMPLIDEALEAAERCGDLLLQFWAHVWRSYAVMEAADTDEAERAAAMAASLAGRLDRPILYWVNSYTTASRLIVRGDFEGAEREAARTLELGTALGQPDVWIFQLALQGNLLMLQGRIDRDYAYLLASTSESTPALQSPRIGAAAVLCEIGLLDEAAAVLTPILNDDVVMIRDDLLWLDSALLASEVFPRLRLGAAAENLYQRLLPLEGRLDYTGVQSWGCVDEGLALLADFLESPDTERHFKNALSVYRRAGAAYFTARVKIRHGDHLARHGNRGRGEPLLREGLATAVERDYPLLEKRARQALGAL